MKRIYTGWYTDQLRQRWTDQCRQALREGRRNFRFLLPTRHLIRQVRESLAESDLGLSDQIGTFDDMVDLGLSKEPRVIRIDEQAKLAVLTRALELAGDEAAAFGRIADKPGFLRSLMEAIEEMKSSGIFPEAMQTWLAAGGSAAVGGSGDAVAGCLRPNVEGDAGDADRKYVRAFVCVYRFYQQLLRDHTAGRLLDRQEGYRVAAEHLLRCGEELLAGIDTVYIDFLTVTPLQFPIVEAICRHVPHVEIFMPYPSRAEGTSLLQQSRSRLIAALHAIGVEHVELGGEAGAGGPSADGCGSVIGTGSDPAPFVRLARALFEDQPERMDASGVELIPSTSPLQEVRAVAKEIKRLVRQGWDLSEIAIVTADDATYRPLIRRVFRDNRIAVRLAEIQNLVEVPVVRYILQAVGEAQAEFPEKTTCAKHAEALCQLVSRLRLVEELYERAAQGGVYRLEDLRRDLRAWQTCQDILASMVRAKRLYGDREVPFAAFWQEWRELLHQMKVQVDAGAGEGVRVYRPEEMRGLSYRGVFLLGLNEGRYPKKPADHWLIERIVRAADGQAAILQRWEQTELQNLLFRYCVQAAGEKLYLGYQSPEADERNLPSPYLEAVIRCLQPGEWTAPPRFRSAMSSLPIADRWEELSSHQEWRERAAIWLGGQPSLHVAEEPDERALERLQAAPELSWGQILDRLAVEWERSSGYPSRFAGRLQDPAIKAILREKFGPDYPWSVSVLNDYAVCPFKFFAARILRIQPREAAEDGIPVQDKGIFLHTLTRRLLLPLTQENQVGAEQVQMVLERFEPVFEQTCLEWEGTQLAASPYWPAEKLRLKQELRLWLERELERLMQSRMRPAHLEWSFGGHIGEDERHAVDAGSTDEPVVVPVGGEWMRLRGQVDRIDLTEDGSQFAIYDYKTGLHPKKYKGIKDLQDGTNWQLPLYLAAYAEWAKQQGRELAPLGGGFRQLSPLPVKMVGVWAAEAGMWGITDTKKSDVQDDLQAVLDEALQRIAEQREALRDGVFDARPRVECDPHCKYLAVCRFDAAKKEGAE
ncbi:PD-(D/E)XK nuclease family protein [Effusibacillus pohliae]|uniref:PD-(D/E)XK nuclease family protein n=1 Tax=Effusibacillus pohliae TaxID=232270 RepID=UPI0012EA7027|nr:PD-(D/E)XK nuclease family protein [Effusibacillus pohliae]